MHRFLRSVGFSRIHQIEDEERLIQDVLSHFDYKTVAENEERHLFVEISKEFAPDMGVTVCGQYDDDNLFHMEYYYPYFQGTQITSYEEVAAERHVRTESFAAACDDMRLGTTMIFYLTNAADFMKVGGPEVLRGLKTSISLTGLADKGTILLPVMKEQKAAALDRKKMEQRNSLFEAAQNGDEEAIESLTMEDMDTFAQLTQRVQKEDIYTIVDSFFMPYGMECDLYSLLGDITDIRIYSNHVTNEKIYQMGIICNEIPLDICINARDLTGVPEVGRRFKGNIWLQGRINF